MGSSMKYSICLDIGGSRTRVAIVDENYSILAINTFDTPNKSSSSDFFRFIENIICSIASNIDWDLVFGIGIACPGPITYPEGIVSPVYIENWISFPLVQKLSESFKCRVVVDNDAKLFALGEALFGAGKNYNIVFGVVISTGIGGGLVINKKLFNGASGNAGHIGHAVVNYKGEICPKGGIGCITTIASGTAIAARAKEALLRGVSSQLLEIFPTPLTAEIVEYYATKGDHFCLSLLQDSCEAIGAALVTVSNIFDPDIIVLGGGIINNSNFIWEMVSTEIEKRKCLAFTKNIRISRSELKDSAGLLGAAKLLFSANNQ